MFVFRIENKEGRGPYVSNSKLTLRLHKEHADDENHPGMGRIIPNYDRFSNEFYCGFESIEKMKQWFKGFMSALSEDGYHISIYEILADYVATDGLQVIFMKKIATKVKNISIRNINKIKYRNIINYDDKIDTKYKYGYDSPRLHFNSTNCGTFNKENFVKNCVFVLTENLMVENERLKNENIRYQKRLEESRNSNQIEY